MNKTDPIVDEVEVINVNPHYAIGRHLNGREVTVSLNDLAPLPQPRDLDHSVNADSDQVDGEVAPTNEQDPSICDDTLHPLTDATPDNPHSQTPATPDNHITIRRSARANKGVPPLRYGIDHENP